MRNDEKGDRDEESNDDDVLDVGAETEYLEDEHEEELTRMRSVELLRDVIETAEFDDATGEVTLRASTSPEGIDLAARFDSLDELRAFLLEFGFYDIRRLGESEAVFGHGGIHRVDSTAVEDALEESNADELFSKIELKGTRLFRVEPTILLPNVRIHIATINEELVRHLAGHPEQLQGLDPRRFEELVCELFGDFGYEVILTPRSRDGGFDIRAIHKDSVGTLLYLVECKRYQRDRPVGVEIVRSLYGVAAAERASCGVLATTSYFTRGAKEFAKKAQYQLSLRDFDDLAGWLRTYPLARKRH